MFRYARTNIIAKDSARLIEFYKSVFHYDDIPSVHRSSLNQRGLARVAFEADGVEAVLRDVLAAGGGQIGEMVRAEYADGKRRFLYTLPTLKAIS